MDYVHAVLFRISADKIEEAEGPQGLLSELNEHRSLLSQLRGFEDVRIIRSINQEGEVQLVVESRWQDDESLMEYETQEPNVSSIVEKYKDLIVPGSLQVTDMEALSPQEKPEPSGEASQRWAMPLLVPAGVLAFSLLVIYGLSRIYLELRHEELGGDLNVATPLAAGITAGILLLAWFLARRPNIRSWQIAGAAGIVAAILLGGSIFVVVHDNESDAEAHGSEVHAEETAAVESEADGVVANELEVTIRMIATNKFDVNVLTIPADEEVSVVAVNEDPKALHNFAVYQDDSREALLGRTEICPGACTEAMPVTLPVGNYLFQCDVHPVQMVGTLVVE